jgi:hypothetical protein
MLCVPNNRVHNRVQSEKVDDLEHFLSHLRALEVRGKTHVGRVQEDIVYGKLAHHDILLWNKSDQLAVVTQVFLISVDQDATFILGDFGCQHGDKSGFTGTRGAHDGAGSATAEDSGYILARCNGRSDHG